MLTLLKLDWRVALPACIFFFALQLDRGNITQALSDNMLSMFRSPSSCTTSLTVIDNLGLTTDDFNNGQTVSELRQKSGIDSDK
jgi:hypothetical protein